MTHYFDASALIKLYVAEPESSIVTKLALSEPAVITGAAIIAEVPAALARSARMGRIKEESALLMMERFRQDWRSSYAVLPLSAANAEQAGDLAWKHPLRGYDAVHLACCLRAASLLDERMVMVTYDRELWVAARSEGLDTVPARW